ncbi:unnamed protein product, partial [Choristocarpus tenellus]
GCKESIKVIVRIRPLLPSEVGQDRQAIKVVEVGEDERLIRVNGMAPNRQLQCRYDAVLGVNTTQEEMYAQVRECASGVLQGLNSTIFAYGQTGSGKTYTMFGLHNDVSSDRGGGVSGAGVIPLAVNDVFQGLATLNVDRGWSPKKGNQASVWCSLVQIYNEQLYDMLRDPQRAHPLTIHEEREAGIYVQGLSEYAMHNAGECLELLRVGSEHRAIRETHMNQASSRSHSIFQVIVEQKYQSEEGGERVLRSKFNLVDLAGSEKWDLGQDMEEAQVNEMNNINVSLYTLGRVIAALSTQDGSSKGGGGKHCGLRPHVPYRESKLTRLLQDSLGGNTRTRVIATLSPASHCLEETISTLRFADCAKQVMAYVRVNEHRPVDYELVVRLQEEVKHLRGVLRDITKRRESGSLEDVASVALSGAQVMHHQEETSHLLQENEHLRVQLAAAVANLGTHQDIRNTPEALQAANRGLEAAMKEIISDLRCFFRFEIEEDELQQRIHQIVERVGAMTTGNHAGNTVNNKLSQGCNGLTSPQLCGHGPESLLPKDAKTDKIMAEGVSFPAVPGLTQNSALHGSQCSGEGRMLPSPLPSARLAYRVQGKHPGEAEMVMSKGGSQECEERRLRRELRIAKVR